MKRAIAFAACLIFCLSFAGCGEKGGDQDKGSNPSELEAYIAAQQAEIDDLISTLEDSGMSLKVEAKGNSLLYSYQYTIDVGDTSLVKDSLEQTMDSMSATFESMLSSLKEEVKSAESLIVEYLDKDGNVLYSKEFK